MSLEIVVGPMFSGKSSYAVAYIRRQIAIGKKVVAIKPDIDNRYSKDNVIVTHNQEKVPCIMWSVDTPMSPVAEMYDSDFIVIEEAQFFRGLRDMVSYLLTGWKKNILIVGLDGDARQKVFGEILDCIPLAEKVTKLNALCSVCKDGTPAPFTRYIENANKKEDSQIDIGGSNKYIAVCFKHMGPDCGCPDH